MRTIRIGTRASRLALVQTTTVKNLLEQICPDTDIEIVRISTSGDRLHSAPLDEIGGKGVFVKDIELKLLTDRIDLAVHSLKDMQAALPGDLCVPACLPREDPRDMFFCPAGHTLQTIPAGSTIGTSSLRRKCQISRIRPDLKTRDIRGNVPTRLGKAGNEVDAVIVAAAGVKRLDLTPGSPIEIHDMIPSPCQGIIGIECRAGDTELLEILSKLDHEPSHTMARAERSFLAALGQDCRLPVGALATLDKENITVEGIIGTLDCTRSLRSTMTGTSPDVGRILAEKLKEEIHMEENQ